MPTSGKRWAQRPEAQSETRARIQSGKATAFCLGKSTQMVVAPPAEKMTPGWSVRSSVHQLSKVVRPGSLTYILAKMYVSDPGRTTFESWCTLERIDQPGVIFSAGGATTIWVDFPKQKAVALPDWMRALVSD